MIERICGESQDTAKKLYRVQEDKITERGKKRGTPSNHRHTVAEIFTRDLLEIYAECGDDYDRALRWIGKKFAKLARHYKWREGEFAKTTPTPAPARVETAGAKALQSWIAATGGVPNQPIVVEEIVRTFLAHAPMAVVLKNEKSIQPEYNEWEHDPQKCLTYVAVASGQDTRGMWRTIFWAIAEREEHLKKTI
jgi:hypothetical protein